MTIFGSYKARQPVLLGNVKHTGVRDKDLPNEVKEKAIGSLRAEFGFDWVIWVGGENDRPIVVG